MAPSVNSETLDQLQNSLGQYPRMHGYYLLKFVPLPLDWHADEERSLTIAFQELDDQTWAPPELRPKDQLWVDYEVDEAKARVHAIEALVGGAAVGHTRDTVPHGDPSAIWKRFRDLFAPDARFFLGLGLGDSAYVFQHGAVVVDDEKAGCLCIVESD
jgi:hypothetical protein